MSGRSVPRPMEALDRRLRILGCPDELRAFTRVAEPVIQQNDAVRVVSWLEDKQIRKWPIDERVRLRTNDEQWQESFRQYLLSNKCPFLHNDRLNMDNMPKYLHWLINQAIGLQFEDSGESINVKCEELSRHPKNVIAKAHSLQIEDELNNQTAEQTKRSAEAQEKEDRDTKLDSTSKEKLRELADLLKLTRAEALQNNEIQASEALPVLQEAGRVIRQRILSVITTEGEPVKAAIDEEATFSDADPKVFPPGLDTHDKLVNKAASILRMLYISDLRELQDAANDILITLQAYTADPKTNTAAGKVGR
eukprot:gb/GECG01014538.1/.p1 GENE.gb/GECG01014538.1/~~gb/GECG01014538.1/.p1  ORF type:complete len:308 (+),score=35.81 gb/GECG01014538.1/:1-924(+)